MNHGQLLIRNICIHKPEDTQDMKDFKVAQTAKRLFPVLYHSFASFGTYWVIKDESWLPWYMGGNGILSEGFDNGPFTPLKPEIYRWGLIILGFPLQGIICHHFIDEHTPDHQEMTLHHIAHFSLSTGYIFANTIPYGLIISFLNDFSDIFIALTKFFHMAGYSVTFTGTVLLLTIVLWLI